MIAIVTYLVEVLAQQKPATAEAFEQLLAAHLNPDDHSQLRIYLEQTLARRDQLMQYLGELERYEPQPLPCGDPFDSEVVAQVSQSGLGVLSLGQLARLAVTPMLLLDLWDAIDDEGLSQYWLRLVDSAMRAEKKERGIKFLSMQEMVARAKTIAGASEGPYVRAAAQYQSLSTAKPALPRWEEEISLSQAEWLSEGVPASVDRLKSQSVVLEFSWVAGGRPSLEVRFLRGELALPGGKCAATLMDPHGRELAVGHVREDCLVFDEGLPGPPEALVESRLVCTYCVEGVYALKLTIPLNPPTAAKD
jgi:hypothetical protein